VPLFECVSIPVSTWIYRLVLTHLLLLLLLLHHLLLQGRVHLAKCLRILHATSHTLPTHLTQHTSHLPAHAHSVGTRLHAHHHASLCNMWLSWSRRTRVAHLLHLGLCHGLAWGHTGMSAVKGHAGVHTAWLCLVGHLCHALLSTRTMWLSCSRYPSGVPVVL